MSVVITVAIQIAEGEQTLINVGRVESVIPTTAGVPDRITQHEFDVIDLVRTVLDRLGSEAHAIADEQIGQLRSILEGEAV